MTHFTLTEQAEDDLIGIAETLAESAGQTAGTLIFDRVYSTADLLATFPEMGRERPDLDSGIRTFPAEDYLICYRIEESVVKIVRIVYQRQDVSKLFGRKNP